MTNDPNDFGNGLNVKGGLRYLYKRFSFGGEVNPAYDKEIERIFGAKPREFCAKCDKRFSWCECPKEEVSSPGSDTDQA